MVLNAASLASAVVATVLAAYILLPQSPSALAPGEALVSFYRQLLQQPPARVGVHR